MGYFDPRPKTSTRDLYDREEALRQLTRSYERKDPLVLLLGLRRTGKTSTLKTWLHEHRVPHVLVDCRVFETRPTVTHQDVVESLSKALEAFKSSVSIRARRLVERIDEIMLPWIRVKLAEGSRGERPLTDFFDRLNMLAEEMGTAVVVAFDEAQELAKLRGTRMQVALAYSYDNNRHLMHVLTGSQIGLLYRFVGRNDADSPLYGRFYSEVRLEPFTPEQSLDFLRRGFEQEGLRPPQETLEKAVEMLDGIVGWLTFYGATAVRTGDPDKALKRTLEEGSRLALRELDNFLSLRPQATARRYLLLLKAVALGVDRWSQLKRLLQAEEGRRISDSVVKRLLDNLADAGFIEKNERDKTYSIPDPMLRYALTRRNTSG